MKRSTRVLGLFLAALGAVSGHLAVSGKSLARPDDPSAPRAPAPGSPDSVAPIDGKSLPPAPPKFGGVIKPNANESTPWWPPHVVPPKGAPNVLLVMTDDVGFGAPSTFGGVIPTPCMDRIARMGLRFTSFHSCALCSPTRAALITGRNHHSAGFGQITELATGFPGYNCILGPDTTTIGTILRDNGYGTSWFGKNHNTPNYACTEAGPFDQWPAGMGFEYFYGFLGGDTSQWQPNLYRNTTPIHPYVGKPGWNLTTAMADEAIEWLHRQNDLAPDKPFFCYYVPGGTHAPHHATPEWIKKISDQHLFDKGWNELRETIFANQKKLGVIPPDAKLTPWPAEILKPWDTLSDNEKKLFIRQVDVYAAFLAYTDHEIGRVVQAIEDLGKLDNTLIIYISGDNGASAEGSLIGTPNEMAQFNGLRFPVERQLKEYYDDWGSDKTYNHMAVGWAWAFDTPYKWAKQIASHFGGTRQGMCMAWPRRIKDAGGIRPQFHHVIDVVPTILEATRIAAPQTVNGVAQKPIEGVSMAYTWDKAAAAAPSRHTTQYFEMFGNRAMYHDGWIASTTPAQPPWVLMADAQSDLENGSKWELYDLHKDWTQDHDMAKEYPSKLKELQELFRAEATKYQVYPLDDTKGKRVAAPRPRLSSGRTAFIYTRPVTGIPYTAAPMPIDRSYTITADVDIPEGGAEGMLNTNGGRFGGYGLYLLKGKPVFTYNMSDFVRFRWEGPDALPPGKHRVEFDFTYNGTGLGNGGTGILKVDGKQVASKQLMRTLPVTFQWDETFDVGSDTGTSVNDKDYQVPFAFTGKFVRLTVTLGPLQVAPAERQHLQDKAGRRD